MRPALSAIVVLLLLGACQPRVARQLARQKAFTLEVRTTGCMGTCPVYQLRLTSDGSAQYRGLHHVAIKDTLTRRLPDSALAKVRQALINSRFSTLDSAYDDTYTTDLPSIVIKLQLPDRGYQKSVTSRIDPPPRLQALEAVLRRLHSTYFQP